MRVGVLGILGMGFCAFAAYEAARTTEATNIGLIYGCTSAFVAAWEIVAGRQRATPMLGLGIAACLFGVVLILTRGHPGVLQDWTFTAGDLWAAAGMLVFVIYTVALRRVPALLTPLAQFTVMSIAATLAFVPLAGAEIAAGGVPPLHERTLPWIAALVRLTGIGAYLGYNISLKHNGPVLTFGIDLPDARVCGGAGHAADWREARLVSRLSPAAGGGGPAAREPRATGKVNLVPPRTTRPPAVNGRSVPSLLLREGWSGTVGVPQ